jgi:hypothetical protein
MDSNIARDTEENCTLDLTLSYGRSVGRRFKRLIENKESVNGRKLKREEILDIYRKFDLELQKSLPIQ